MENSAQPKPVRNGLFLAELTNQEIKDITERLGTFKYAKAFAIIASNPAILTHELSNQVFANNIPDLVACLNRKLMNFGFIAACSPPAEKKLSNSHHWHIYRMPTSVIDVRSACNDEVSE